MWWGFSCPGSVQSNNLCDIQTSGDTMKEMEKTFLAICVGICTICCLYTAWKLNVLESQIKSVSNGVEDIRTNDRLWQKLNKRIIIMPSISTLIDLDIYHIILYALIGFLASQLYNKWSSSGEDETDWWV